MSDDLNRIRSAVGIPVTSGAPAPVTLEDFVGARAGRAASMEVLRWPAVGAMVFAFVTFTVHRPAWRWVAQKADTEDLFVYRWIEQVLAVANAHVWLPFVALAAFAVLVAAALMTEGFSAGGIRETAATVSAGGVGAISAAPLLIATVMGVVAIVVFVALMILLLVGVVLLIGGILSDL